MKKVLYLFLALLLPGLIFVFLKYQGKNEFTVPVFYENGVEFPDECRGKSPAGQPYKIPGLTMEFLGMDHEVNVLTFPTPDLDFDRVKLAIDDEMGKDIVWMQKADSLEVNIPTATIEISMEGLRCVFLIKDPFQSVLVDKEGRIRGYYDLRKRDEIDKLRVELKILLKKY